MVTENDDPGARSSERLISSWWPTLIAGACHILHDRDDAEDAVQDVLLGIMARDRALQGTPLQYLRTAVHNRGVDVVRQRHAQGRLRLRERPLIPVVDVWDPARIDQERLYDAVIRCVRDMREPERSVAKLYFWEGYGSRRIAGILGIREKSVQRIVARVRRKIRDACRSGG